MNSDGVLITTKWGKVGSPADLSSGGLGPAIVVGIYDRKKKMAYMCESIHDHEEWGEIRDFCKWVLTSTDIQYVTICMTGASYCPDEDANFRKSISDFRLHAERTVRMWFQKRPLRIEWGKPNTATELTIDAQRGTFLISEKDLFEFGHDTFAIN